MSFTRYKVLGFAFCGLVGAAMSASAPTDAHAAMAPEYERVRQFNIIMSAANDAAQKLSKYGLIDSIERGEDGAFRFRAGRCFAPARLEALPADETAPRPGDPTHYRVALGEVRCD